MWPRHGTSLLSPLGWLYGLGTRVRDACYDHRLLRVQSLPVPVICVGNLTVGGTGKTPVVMWIVEELRRLGKRPGVLARGYGRQPGDMLNDEGRMLAAAIPDLPQVQDPDRFAGGRELIETHGVDLIVMDDGFQHRRLARDLDLVCIDAESPFGGGACLPAGFLREPAIGLARAGAVVLTRYDRLDAAAAEPLGRLVRSLAPNATVYKATHSPLELVDRPSGETRPPDDLAGRAVFLLSAIGQPDHFETTVRRLGADIKGHRSFIDHHVFTAAELEAVAAQASAAAAVLVTTEKDEARLCAWTQPRLVLKIRIGFLGASPDLTSVADAGA